MQKEKRQEREKDRKDAMKVPLDPLPERQLCECEKIREDIIEERRLAMAKCKFFEDLKDTKLEIGLFKDPIKDAVQKENANNKDEKMRKKSAKKLKSKVKQRKYNGNRKTEVSKANEQRDMEKHTEAAQLVENQEGQRVFGKKVNLAASNIVKKDSKMFEIISLRMNGTIMIYLISCRMSIKHIYHSFILK